VQQVESVACGRRPHQTQFERKDNMIRVLIFTDQPVLASGFVKALAGAGLEDMDEMVKEGLATVEKATVLFYRAGETPPKG